MTKGIFACENPFRVIRVPTEAEVIMILNQFKDFLSCPVRIAMSFYNHFHIG